MKGKIDEDYAKQVLNESANKITLDDFIRVLKDEKQLKKLFKDNLTLGRFVEDGNLLLSLVRDYYQGTYREIPWISIASVVAALLYVISPLDLIPDFIPIFGYVDDMVVFSVCLMLVETDLHKYREWKQTDK